MQKTYYDPRCAHWTMSILHWCLHKRWSSARYYQRRNDGSLTRGSRYKRWCHFGSRRSNDE